MGTRVLELGGVDFGQPLTKKSTLPKSLFFFVNFGMNNVKCFYMNVMVNFE